MEKKSVYILLLLFMLHNTALNEMLKLPKLVEHFHEHQHRDCTIGVTDFLRIHYWGQDLNDNDDDRDRQLPYKSTDLQTAQHSFIPLAKSIVLVHTDYRSVQISYPRLADSYIPDPALTSLFRPPRA